MVRVQSTQPIDSPAYDLDVNEDQVPARLDRYFQSSRAGKSASPTGA
jgi:hypothetical protein